MSFMIPQYTYGCWLRVSGLRTEYVQVDELCGTLPIEVGQTVCRDDPEYDHILPRVSDYIEDQHPEFFELVEGWGARMSAPGYLDCTDWCVFPTREEAEEYIEEYFV